MEFLSSEAVGSVAQKLQELSSVLVRGFFVNREGNWSLHTLIIDAFPHALQDPYPSYCYNYGRFAFCSKPCVSGSEASAWILHRQGSLQGLSFQVPELPEQTSPVGKYPSHTISDEFTPPLPWPCTRFEITISSVPTYQQLDQKFLTSQGCPLFPNFQTAMYALLYGHTKEWDRAQNFQQSKILIRLAEIDAWIESIHLSPLSLSIGIEGSLIQNTFLQVQAPPYPHFEQAVEKIGTVDCPLPDGLPKQVWIVLSRGHGWLDYRILDQRWSPFDTRHTDINTDPPDMATQIQALIAQGEGLTLEFKEDTPDDKEQMLKTMAAFANGEGGVIILGVKDKTGELVGLKGDIARKKDEILNMIRNSLVPEITVQFEECVIEHRSILAIYVDKGQSPPYGLNPTKPAYYVRRGSTTFPARQEECRTLARSTPALHALRPAGFPTFS